MLKLSVTKEAKCAVANKVFVELSEKFEKVMKKRITEKIKKRNGEVDLVFVSDKKMQEMNLEYRKKNSPTDIISFAYLEVTEYEDWEESEDIIVGDIFISVETAKKQAKEQKHSLEKEMRILFVHGMLHLFGFDHQNDAQEKEMEKWAKKVLA
ncbi:rRNA maturation RNase YbeY [Candidatus Gracilibacteria bacterium]|nr:rRNA maturation RNase YbeY [Candidatus Gracilibacteria bacterium]